jgi:hypothetical protein
LLYFSAQRSSGLLREPFLESKGPFIAMGCGGSYYQQLDDSDRYVHRVSLKKPGDSATPVGLSIKEIDTRIVITDLLPNSLISRWNSQNPSERVRKGDILLGVNGITTPFWEVAGEIWLSQALELELFTKTSGALCFGGEVYSQKKKACIPLAKMPQARADACDATECSICCDNFADDAIVVKLPHCGHAFHPECIGQWRIRGKDTCPLCRDCSTVLPLS